MGDCLVCRGRSLFYFRRSAIGNKHGRSPFFSLGRDPYGIATLHAKSVQSAPFEMVEMDRIVGGKRGWVTPGLSEYAWWGDRSSKQEIRL
ncbi:MULTISPECIES: hypothetical protein [unclassified Microcoleus]|uniref:hypothetical protein n=1 Tax=unclassified Microcoleus TaxID=2642155 RepID=UPI001D6127D7|nr:MULTISPECIES: hypothetical protein [unclassified Microcoleus]MCC3466842.1 hypothetical protein [Microcoleus sp. PH2017_06_SFM_O_A]MCC3415028.1 hypothetical protein [Microcoleus sp. PH2017_02_FOX_O_A]MCC3519186.1 hypothetical protein [Microcoleus sp. PH2017_18_LLB_O_A]MCC3565752.1 hypothetical protein [Microcoleus sp. PH2017_31_RDM_U_A]MCC3578096.1 hypothetical protein [Microcoleus sp. PH2017_32_RDM_D_A]